MAFKPSMKRKAGADQIEPDVTPIMNLMVVLIPLLLSVAEFVQLALLQYSPPPIEVPAEGEGADDMDDSPAQGDVPLNLLLSIVEDGFELSMFGATSGENYISVPKLPSVFYYMDGLRAELLKIRQDIIGKPLDETKEIDPETGQEVSAFTWKYSDAEMLRIQAKGDIPWQILVSVLDESREFEDDDNTVWPMFPQPVLGQMQ